MEDVVLGAWVVFCVTLFQGMFMFVLFDEPRLVLARVRGE